MTAGDPLLEMLGRYADGIASEEEIRSIEAALRANAAFRQRFLRYLNVDAMLAAAPASSMRRLTARSSADSPGRSRWRGAAWFGAGVAAMLLVALTVWGPLTRSLRQVTSTSDSTPATTQNSLPPAILIASTDARWSDPDVELALRSGDMPGGILRLETGMAEFRFAHGATALVLGPAAIQFSGPNRLFVQDGKVLCQCPTPDSRITLLTPATQVVDLGTEFAVDVAPDRSSTRIAVVSGEVRVGTDQTRVLSKGQAAQVGADRVVRLTPVPAETLSALLSADPSHTSAAITLGPSLLAGPSALPSGSGGDPPWQLTDGYADLTAANDGSYAIDVHSRGHRLWPGARQIISTGDISGRLVVASVEGESMTHDPLCERQSAILKLAFLDSQHHEFATAFRHFLRAGEATGKSVAAHVAAYAPPGTQAVQIQLLLSARSQPGGSVRFQDPRLSVAAMSQTIPATRPQ